MLLTPVLPILMTFAASTPAQPIDTSPVTQARSVLHTPDAIAPAVLPYVACLYAVRGLPFVLGSNGRHISYATSDGNCSAERRRAKADAIKLLENKPIPGGGAATSYVENVLAEIDVFVGPVRGAQASTPSPPVGIPLTIEDEVQPAYDRYEDCLKTQVSDGAISRRMRVRW